MYLTLDAEGLISVV